MVPLENLFPIDSLIVEKQKWEAMKNEKELLNAKEIKTIEHGITSKKNAIARYQKKYKKIYKKKII